MKRKYSHLSLVYLLLACGTFLLSALFLENPAEARSLHPSLTISGSLGKGYLPAAHTFRTHARFIDRKIRIVDTVIAIPVVKGKLSSQSIAQGVKSAIHANGSFNLSLTRDKDYVLVLVNSKSRTATRFAGQIAFRTEASQVFLPFLPTEQLRGTRLNLGRIEAEGDLALPARMIKNNEWLLTPTQISFLAANGTSFKNVKNMVINYDAGNGIYYSLRPDFRWEGAYAGMKSGISYPSMYTHYNFQMDSNSQEITMDMICGTNGVPKAALELFPPAGTSVLAKYPPATYDSNTPIANNNAVCSPTPDSFIEARDEDFFATNRYGDISFSFGSSLLSDPVPGGYWQYKVNGALRAQFDEGVTAPKTADGMINGLIPAIHANLDANGRITSFSITWYQRDESSPIKYTEVTDLSVLGYLVESAGIFIENNSTGQRRYESVSYDPVTQTVVTMTNDWYYGTSGNTDTQAERIGTFYSSAGLGYFFEYPRIVYPAGNPACILPIPASEINKVKKGQQYQPTTHDGLDFGFTDWPAVPGQYVLYDIVAPVTGFVTEIKGHTIPGVLYSENNYAYTMVIRYNEGWSTFVCFEPDTKDQAMVDLQKQKLYVTPGKKVNQGDVIGQLVVSQPSSTEVFGPHVHWQLYRTNDNGQSVSIVCPRTYSTPQAVTTLDALYQSVGISPPCAVP